MFSRCCQCLPRTRDYATASFLVFSQGFADTIVRCVLPIAVLGYFEAAALTPEALTEAPRKSVHLLAFATFAEYFVAVFADSIALELCNTIGRNRVLLTLLASSFMSQALLWLGLSPISVIISAIFRGIGHVVSSILRSSLDEQSSSDAGARSLQALRSWSVIAGCAFGLLFASGLSMQEMFSLTALWMLLTVCCAGMLLTKSQVVVDSKLGVNQSLKMKAVSWGGALSALRTAPSTSLLLLMMSSVVPMSSGLWVFPLQNLLGFTNILVVALVLAANASGAWLAARLIPDLKRDFWTIPVALASKASCYLVASQTVHPAAAIVSLALIGFPLGWAEQLVRVQLATRLIKSTFSGTIDQYVSVAKSFGNAAGALTFLGFFELGHSTGSAGLAFFLYSLVSFSCAAFAAIMMLWSAHDFEELPQDDDKYDVEEGSFDKPPQQIQPSFHHDRPQSPALSTVTEEDETVRHRSRRNSVTSVYSESSMDFNIGRPFGDTVVEWDMPESIKFEAENLTISVSPIPPRQDQMFPRRMSGGLWISSPGRQLIPGRSPPIEELGSGRRDDGRHSSRTMRKWNSMEAASPGTRLLRDATPTTIVGRRSSGGFAPIVPSAYVSKTGLTPHMSPESFTSSSIEGKTSSQTSIHVSHRRWASVDETAAPSSPGMDQGSAAKEFRKRLLRAELEHMISSVSGLNLLDGTVTEEGEED